MKHSRQIIYLAGFVFALAIALMAYINSSFIASFVGEKYVGAIYTLGSAASVIALLAAPSVFRRTGGYKFLTSAIALNAFAIFLFAFSQNNVVAITLFIVIFTLNILIFFSLDEFLEIVSKDTTTGRIRGSYVALGSIAWILSQLLLGTILGEFSLRTIYLVGFATMLVFFCIVFFYFKRIPEPRYGAKETKNYIGQFFRDADLFRAYKMNFLLQFFYCLMVIYTPIYLSQHLGFTWKEIGIMFSVMLLPFAIIPFPLGKYADKIGERKILMLAFLVASFATMSLFFIQSHSVAVWALLLFATRIGAASIEVATDAYFFKHIKPEDEEWVGVYRNASPSAYILAPLFAFLFLLFIPSFNFLYLILGAFMLSGIYLASTIRKSDI